MALKIVKESERGSQQTAARFWREAELTSKLQHPNIVSIYDAERSHGTANTTGFSPFYVMQVYGNRNFLKAITAYHARQRSPQAGMLLVAIEAFLKDHSVRNEQNLQRTLKEFTFDESQSCDQDLKQAVGILLKKPCDPTGRSLREAIQAFHKGGRQPSELRELLNQFINVCNALAYAHSRGVIHRDLKPQNVMLGEFGETIVVDWGLAKVVGGSDDPSAILDEVRRPATFNDQMEFDSKTGEGTFVGTPDFAPPEQAAGRVMDLTAATDIYSLGGILFAILTGAPPRKGSSRVELIQMAKEGRVATPSSLQPDVPKPLEAVCLKALSKEPIDRYATAQDLAADVGHWLADEPVSAWPEPVVVRAKRWAKSHQTLVGSTAAAVLVAVLTLSVMLSIVAAQKSKLANVNQELLESNQREAAARLLAQDNEAEADLQRDAAIQQSHLALATLTSVIFDVQRGLENLPGGGEVRRRLLSTSLLKLDQVATEYVEQAAVDQHTLAALIDMGDVILQFGVGDDDEWLSLHKPVADTTLTAEQRSAVDLAQMFYARANKIGERLVEADSDSLQTQLDLAYTFEKQGDINLLLNQVQQALEYHHTSFEIRRQVAADNPENAWAERALCVSSNKLGQSYLLSGQTQDAIANYEFSCDRRLRWLEEHPQDTLARKDVCVSYHRLGEVRLQRGEVQEARHLCQKALEINQDLATEDPSNQRLQLDLSLAYEKIADVEQRSSNTPQVIEFIALSQRILRNVVTDDPENAEARRLYMASLIRLGDVGLQMGLTQDAQESYRESLNLCEWLIDRDASSAQFQRDLTVVLNKLGDVCLELEETREAYALYLRARYIREELAARDPANAEAQRDLSISFEKLGKASIQLERLTEAHEHLLKSLEIREQLALIDPTDAQSQRDLSIVYKSLGDLSRLRSNFEEAQDDFERVREISQMLVDVDPANAEARRDLSVSLNCLGDVSLSLRQLHQAVSYYQQYNAMAAMLLDADPTSAVAHRDLSISFGKLGEAFRESGQFGPAISSYQAAIAILDELIATDRMVEAATRDRDFWQTQLESCPR